MNRGLQAICEQLGKASADLLPVGVAIDERAVGALEPSSHIEHLVLILRDLWETALRARFKRNLTLAMLDATAEAFNAHMIAKTSPVAQEMRGLDPLKIVM